MSNSNDEIAIRAKTLINFLNNRIEFSKKMSEKEKIKGNSIRELLWKGETIAYKDVKETIIKAIIE